MELDFDDYVKVVNELKFSVVGWFVLQRGDSSLTNMQLNKKLEELSCLQGFKLISLKGGVFHILLNSSKDQSKAMAR